MAKATTVVTKNNKERVYFTKKDDIIELPNLVDHGMGAVLPTGTAAPMPRWSRPSARRLQCARCGTGPGSPASR